MPARHAEARRVLHRGKTASVPIQEPAGYRQANATAVGPPINVNFPRADRLVPIQFDPLRAGPWPVPVRPMAVIVRTMGFEAVVDRIECFVAGNKRGFRRREQCQIVTVASSSIPALTADNTMTIKLFS